MQNTVVRSHSTNQLPQALRGKGVGWGVTLKNKTSPLFSAEWTGACGPHAPLTQGSFILSTPSTPFKAPATFSKMPFQQLVTAIPLLFPPPAASSSHTLLFLPIKYSSLTGIKGAMQFKDYHMPLIMWLPCFWSAVHAWPRIYSLFHFLSLLLSVDSSTVWLQCAVYNGLWTGRKRHGKSKWGHDINLILHVGMYFNWKLRPFLFVMCKTWMFFMTRTSRIQKKKKKNESIKQLFYAFVSRKLGCRRPGSYIVNCTPLLFISDFWALGYYAALQSHIIII